MTSQRICSLPLRAFIFSFLFTLAIPNVQATVYRNSPMSGFVSGNLGSVGTAEGWSGGFAYCTVAAGSGSLDGTGLGLTPSRGDMAATTSSTGNTFLLFAPNSGDIDIAVGS